MKFLIDTQLPKILAQRLRDQGEEAEHVLDLAMEQSQDDVLWQYATTHGAVIVTKDEDFSEWVLTGRDGPSVVWLRVGNCTNVELLEWLLPVWTQIVRDLEVGERLVEVV
ncbi:MAG: DUF5615 family PIN-like protein [Verrucomicrobiae bacterium]